jgi:hypothetical protein
MTEKVSFSMRLQEVTGYLGGVCEKWLKSDPETRKKAKRKIKESVGKLREDGSARK